MGNKYHLEIAALLLGGALDDIYLPVDVAQKGLCGIGVWRFVMKQAINPSEFGVDRLSFNKNIFAYDILCTSNHLKTIHLF